MRDGYDGAVPITTANERFIHQERDVVVLVSNAHLHLPVAPGVALWKSLLLLTHTGRRSGVRRQTVLEVVEYRGEGPEVIVANGFGPVSDWLRNIQARSDEEVTVGPKHFAASHRFLGEDEAVKVIEQYEHRNRLITPIVRAGFTGLLGWRYRATETDRRQLVRQIPLLAFRPRFGSTG